ncbi:MAG: 1-deoxy-D-xylulose-5-phosphate synthase N-terminal domain-containing protein [Candidatus Omnitrophota bacterium]
MKLTAEQKSIRRRIIEISYEKRLSHLGSCLSVIDIISAVYRVKRADERFILSNGHAGIALYAILEKHGFLHPADMKKLSVHPDRNPDIGIDVSAGSLGQGLPIAIGMALAERRKNVYCVISDGECSEGSIWESLRIGLEKKIGNLKVIINANGWGAYDAISASLLINRIRGFGYKAKSADGHDVKGLERLLKTKSADSPLVVFAETTVEQLPFLKGQDAHYHVMTAADFELAKEVFE